MKTRVEQLGHVRDLDLSEMLRDFAHSAYGTVAGVVITLIYVMTARGRDRLISLVFSSVGALVVETFGSGLTRFEAVFIGVFACVLAWS